MYLLLLYIFFSSPPRIEHTCLSGLQENKYHLRTKRDVTMPGLGCSVITAKKYVARASASLENKYPQYADKCKIGEQYACQGIDMLDSAAEYAIQSYHTYAPALGNVRDWNLQAYAPLVLGFMMTFFGRYFTLLTIVAETVHMMSWRDIKRAYHMLKKNYDIAIDQYERDNAPAPVMGTGLQSMDAIMPIALSRRASLFAKSVNVEELNEAAHTLAGVIFPVAAALLIPMVRTLTISRSIASMIHAYIPLEDKVVEALPPQWRKFSSVIAAASVYVASLSVAMVLSTVIVTIDCALRGSQMFVRHLLRRAHMHNMLTSVTDATKAAQYMAMGMATLGFLWQMAHGSGLPFPLNLLLLPLTIMESVLRLVAYLCSLTMPLL